MVPTINTGTTLACNGVQRLVENEGAFKRHVQSRIAAPFTAAPLLADAVANVVVGVVKAVLAAVTKVVELAYAFFGKDRAYGNFACEAANHFGKALMGGVAVPLTLVIGLLAPSAVVMVCRALGLAATPAANVNTEAQQATRSQTTANSQVQPQTTASTVTTAKNASQHSAVVEQEKSESVANSNANTVTLYAPSAAASKVKELSLVQKAKNFGGELLKLNSKQWNNDSTAKRYAYRAVVAGAPTAAVVTGAAYGVSAAYSALAPYFV